MNWDRRRCPFVARLGTFSIMTTGNVPRSQSGRRHVRLTAAEKGEVIRLVEGSELSVRQTLRELQVPRATFYTWYRRYAEGGLEALAPQPAAVRRHWNRIPPRIRQKVVDSALAAPERTPRELAWHFTDREGHFLSESSVYRILKAYDLIASPTFIVLTAGKTFPHPTRRPNELWQTDFTYLHVVGWGWYYLSTVLDDILAVHPGVDAPPVDAGDRRHGDDGPSAGGDGPRRRPGRPSAAAPQRQRPVLHLRATRHIS